MTLSRNVELEAAILERPTDYERFAVYGDWLAQRGDARGALMVAGAELAACHASSAAKRPRMLELRRIIDSLWRDSQGAIEGSLAPLLQRGLTLEWRMGCVHEAVLVVPPDESGAATIRQLLAHPTSWVISKISVRTDLLGEHGFNYQPIVDLVSECCPRTLRALALGDLDGWTDDETVVLGDLRPLFARHTGLESVTLAGRASTVSAPWSLGDLTELTLRPVGLSRTWLRVINAESWPSLRRLTFSYVSALDADIEWLCSSRLPQRYPQLTSLAVIGTQDAASVIDVLGATGLSRQLQTLNVSWGQFGAEAVERLNVDRDDFPRLDTLVVERGIRALQDIREGLRWLDVRAV